MSFGRYAKDHGELVIRARQFLERHADLISGVVFEIESQHGLVGSDGAGQILANVLRLQDGGIRVEEVNRPSAADQLLRRRNPRAQRQHTHEVVRFPESIAPKRASTHRHEGEHLWYQRSRFDATGAIYVLWSQFARSATGKRR